MVETKSAGRKIFEIFNVAFLSLVTLTCIVPFVHLLAISLSSNKAAISGIVFLIPKGFTLKAYSFLVGKSDFIRAFLMSIQRELLGTTISMLVVILTAYPLSKENTHFRWRTRYTWFFAFTMFFNGGLIPLFITIRNLGMIDKIWSLVIPSALNIWNVVLMLNFFRCVPKELEESALLDGASHWRVLFTIFIPVSLPAVATLLLFTVVYHWNAWFDGLIYMNSPKNYPLQSYIYVLISSIKAMMSKRVSKADLAMLRSLSDKTLRTAQIFLAMLPVMIVYPFLQKYFIKGIVLGSVKE
jgi:putative aldouronate transport system permease protein